MRGFRRRSELQQSVDRDPYCGLMVHHLDWFILIPTVGRPELLGRTLSSLIEAGLGNYPVEIVVIENGGTQRVRTLCESLAARCRIRYQAIPQAGQSVAYNAFIDRHPGVFVWFLDDDVRVTPEAIRAYHAATQRGQVGREYYGGPLGIDYETPPPDWLRAYLPRSARGWTFDPAQPGHELPIFLGANWAAWTNDLTAVGSFDPRFGPGQIGVGGETLLQKALMQHGLSPVYLPQALVYHWVPRNRCSPRWALRRAYRIGFADGYEQTADGPFLLGYPRWMYRGLLERFARWCVTRLSPRAKRRFAAAYELRFYLGWMAGKRAGRDHRSPVDAKTR